MGAEIQNRDSPEKLSRAWPAPRGWHLINGERSGAFTPFQLSLAEYRPEITRLAYVEAG